MTEEERQSIFKFEAKVKKLIADFRMLKQENENLKSALTVKENEVEELSSDLLQLQQDYDILKTAKMISISDEDKKMAKLRISKMVREVNKCINILSSGKSEEEESDANEPI